LSASQGLAAGAEGMSAWINRLASLASMRRRVGAAAIGGLFAICCILAADEVQAKQRLPGADQDSETPDASSPPDNGKGGQSTVITGEIVETHDRLTPEVFRGIHRVHSFRISLSGKNHVSETWTVSRPDMGDWRLNQTSGNHSGNKRRGGFGIKQTEDAVTIGETGSHVVWHVLGEKKLQRIFAGQHFLMMMDIEIGPDNSCRVDARYLKQTGFESVVMRRSDNDELADFTLPQVEHASCAIQ
jgi:hypothetical protein